MLTDQDPHEGARVDDHLNAMLLNNFVKPLLVLVVRKVEVERVARAPAVLDAHTQPSLNNPKKSTHPITKRERVSLRKGGVSALEPTARARARARARTYRIWVVLQQLLYSVGSRLCLQERGEGVSEAAGRRKVNETTKAKQGKARQSKSSMRLTTCKTAFGAFLRLGRVTARSGMADMNRTVLSIDMINKTKKRRVHVWKEKRYLCQKHTHTHTRKQETGDDGVRI